MSRGRGQGDEGNTAGLRSTSSALGVTPKTPAEIFAAVSGNVPEEIRAGQILMVQAGSKSLGCSTADSSDEDYIGIFIEPKSSVFGLSDLDYWESSTSDKDMRKGAGDVEIRMFGLNKFISLAAKGNPDILGVLYAPLAGNANGDAETEIGRLVREHASIFASQSAGKRYLGYMNGQVKALLSGSGMKVNRPELIEKYGFDTKYAYHALRLGQQGVDFLNEGKLTLPLPESQRAFLMDVRAGKYTLDEVKEMAVALDEKLKLTLDNSPLPATPDRDAVNQLLIDCYERYYYPHG